MTHEGYGSPEEAARGDIPAKFGHIVATVVSPDDRWALVLLAENVPPSVELYQVLCERIDGSWHDTWGGNGSGLSWRATEGDIGVQSLVREVPFDVTEAVVRHRGREDRVPVHGGIAFFAVFDVPSERTAEDIPEIVSYLRANGTVEPAPTDLLARVARKSLHWDDHDDDGPPDAAGW